MTGRADIASERAALWVLRQEEPGWSAGQQAELDAWLAESMLHRAAYLRQREGWRAADRVAALGRPEEDAQTPWYRRWQPWAMAASLVACVGAGTFALLPAPSPIVATRGFQTPVGGHQTVPLQDGSTVELNTATTIRTAVSSSGRDIWLDRGEAYFEVAHRDGLPFVVHAGSRTVTVLGTKFSVRRDREKVTVSVIEGRVRVDDATSPQAVRSATITAGDIAIGRGASTLVTVRAEERVESALAWRDGMLNFDDMRLADAAAEFNRYNTRKIVIGDAAAADMRIDGAFQASNIDAFVRLLRDAYRLDVTDTGGTVNISSR